MPTAHDDNETEEITYNTYRGTAHVAMVMGIPMMIMLFSMLFMGVVFFACMVFMNSLILALILMGLNVAVLIWVRVECENDPRAMTIRWLEVKSRFFRRGRKRIVITSQVPGKKQEQRSVQRYFKKLHRIL